MLFLSRISVLRNPGVKSAKCLKLCTPKASPKPKAPTLNPSNSRGWPWSHRDESRVGSTILQVGLGRDLAYDELYGWKPLIHNLIDNRGLAELGIRAGFVLPCSKIRPGLSGRPIGRAKRLFCTRYGDLQNPLPGFR